MNYPNDIINSFNNYLIQKGITNEDSKQYVEKMNNFFKKVDYLNDELRIIIDRIIKL